MLVSKPLLGIFVSVLTINYHQYAKCLGNSCPKSVIHLEIVIWKALFSIACGKIDVYAAEKLIADAIPNILKNLEDSNEAWFQLGLSNLF
jgi:hypothetical protein